MATFKLKQRTYLTADGKVAKADEDAAFLLGAEGAEISEEQAIELGLKKKAATKKSTPEKNK